MYAEISAAISSAKTALELAKAANVLANFNELVSAVSEVNTRLLAATAVALASQEKQAALLEQVASLKEELRSVSNWEALAKDYRLQAVGVEQKHFARVHRPENPSSEAKHWACAKCFQERKLYILSGHGRFDYKCPNCQSEISPIVQGGSLAPIESAYAQVQESILAPGT